MPFANPYDNVFKMPFKSFFRKQKDYLMDEERKEHERPDVSFQFRTGDFEIDQILFFNSDVHDFVKKHSTRLKFFIKSSSSSVCIDKDRRLVFKFFDKNKANIFNQFLHESDINNTLTKLNIRGVPKTVDIYQDTVKKVYLLVQEYKGSDGVELLNDGMFTQKARVELLKQIPNIINSVHSNGFIHLDIKLENLCLQNNEWFLIDWGLGKKINGTLKGFTGTIPLMSPIFDIKDKEIILNRESNAILDYFSFSLSVLDLFYRLYNEHCENCLNFLTPCKECMKPQNCPNNNIQKRFFTRVNTCDIISILLHPDDYMGKQPKFIRSALCHLARIILTQLSPRYDYAVWDRRSYKLKYQDKNECHKLIEPPLKTSTEEWNDFVRFVNTEKID